MAVLIGCSAFFSASEAALFYLRPADVRALEQGSTPQRVAAGLLGDPDRLLSAVLFWNLAVNVTYFAISSIVSIELGQDKSFGNTGLVIFSFASLMTIIFFSEMLPKSVAVLSPRRLAALVSIPLAVTVRVVDPLMPLLRTINLLSRRLIWPSFQGEPYMEISDLERAIELSTSDRDILEQEQRVLSNIVQLGDLRVDELMRPRMQFLTFAPPVMLEDLRDRMPPSGYLLVTDPGSEDVVSALRLAEMSDVPEQHLEHKAEPVVYVPWCTSVADALEQMETRDREVAAVVNEFGETIGILTYADILDTIFTSQPSRSDRLLNRQAIVEVRPDVWHVNSITSLRRLARHFRVRLPSTKVVTVGGIIQDCLQRMPAAEDECDWGPFHFRVLSAPQRGRMQLELVLRAQEEDLA